MGSLRLHTSAGTSILPTSHPTERVRDRGCGQLPPQRVQCPQLSAFRHPPGLQLVLARASSRTEGSTEGSTAVSVAGAAHAEEEDDSKRSAVESPRALESDEEVASLMEGVTFAQICDDFVCVSSPAVERTARRLAKDIHDIRENRRNISCFAIDVKYKDPFRSFMGREGYRRPSWIINGLNNPRVDMVGMRMQSTSQLVIKWRLRGDFRMLPASRAVGGGLDLLVTSTFCLNQISGQVTEHRDEWDLSRTPLPAVLAFYSSRLAWTTVQSGKDLSEALSMVGAVLNKAKGQDDIVFRDPSGDPRKFFIQEDPNRELYQYALAVALLYLLVQFLRVTL